MKEEIIELLRSTNREGMENLINYIVDGGFFESPASTRFHGVYSGGLAAHSLGVYKLLGEMNERLELKLEKDTIIICALLHDLCKMGAYQLNGISYKFNSLQPKGHGVLSVERIKQFISLSPLEEKMIMYHMGIYGLKEFDERSGEYQLRGGGLANAYANHIAVKVIYFCDEMATIMEKR